MDKLLSITKNSEREVTITAPLGQSDMTMIIVSYLSSYIITLNLRLTLYKVALQDMIVFNFKGEKEDIEKLIKAAKGLC